MSQIVDIALQIYIHVPIYVCGIRQTPDSNNNGFYIYYVELFH